MTIVHARSLVVAVLFAAGFAVVACADDASPDPGSDPELDLDPGAAVDDGTDKADGQARGLIGTWQPESAQPGALRLVSFGADGRYRFLPAGGVEQAGTYQVDEDEWGQPRLQLLNELGNLVDVWGYAFDRQVLILLVPDGSSRYVRASGSCAALGGTCRFSDMTPGSPPSCEDEWGEVSAPAFCPDFSMACCATPTGW